MKEGVKPDFIINNFMQLKSIIKVMDADIEYIR
jgi:hypothetical protein